jgi:hypothetical protein
VSQNRNVLGDWDRVNAEQQVEAEIKQLGIGVWRVGSSQLRDVGGRHNGSAAAINSITHPCGNVES